MHDLPPTLFITGTGTDVGKTLCAAQLYRQRGGVYFKPVQTGDDDDTAAFRRLTGAGADAVIEPIHRFSPPLSPHLAAARCGARIDPNALKLPDPCPHTLIVEGAGGVLVPLTDDFLMIDLMAAWKLPVLVVTRAVLGMINHTLLTIEALRARDLSVCGLAVLGDTLNDGLNDDRLDDIATITRLTNVRCVLPPLRLPS